MTPPTILTARKLATEHSASLGAIVLLFDADGKVAGARDTAMP